MQFVVYTVEELNRFGHMRSLLITEDPITALSDWMIRAHNPLGFPPGIKPGSQELRIEVVGKRMPIGTLHILIECEFHYKGEVVRKVRIDSGITTIKIDEGFNHRTANIYKSEQYWGVIQKNKERVQVFSENNLHVAYILSQFAARNPNHHFWKPGVASKDIGGLRF